MLKILHDFGNRFKPFSEDADAFAELFIQIRDMESSYIDKVVIGKWIFDNFTAKYGNPYRCNQCKEESDDTYNYCPNCGAKMKGE